MKPSVLFFALLLVVSCRPAEAVTPPQPTANEKQSAADTSAGSNAFFTFVLFDGMVREAPGT